MVAQSDSFLLIPSGLFILMTTIGLAGSCLIPWAWTAAHRKKLRATMATVARRSTFIEILSLQTGLQKRLKFRSRMGLRVQNPSQRGPIITMIAQKLQDTAGSGEVEKPAMFI